GVGGAVNGINAHNGARTTGLRDDARHETKRPQPHDCHAAVVKRTKALKHGHEASYGLCGRGKGVAHAHSHRVNASPRGDKELTQSVFLGRPTHHTRAGRVVRVG